MSKHKMTKIPENLYARLEADAVKERKSTGKPTIWSEILRRIVTLYYNRQDQKSE